MIIRYGDIVANYHKGITANAKVAIWISGMPVLPRDSEDSDMRACFAGGYDVIIPEYIGSGRSDGVFNVDNCFKTVYHTIDLCLGGGARDCYTEEHYDIRYDSILLIGYSFGGYWVTRLKEYHSKIIGLGLICPYLSQLDPIGEPEETMEDVERTLYLQGMKYLYRMSNLTRKEFESSLSENHQDIFQYIPERLPLFLSHGDSDTCIHVSRSRNFYSDYQQSLAYNNASQYLELYACQHGGSTKRPTIAELIKRSSQLTHETY